MNDAEFHIALADRFLDNIADGLVAAADGEQDPDTLGWTFTASLATAHALTAIAMTMLEERAWMRTPMQ